ncbi:fumarate reductase [Trichophyton tonsurans CBS 112818]|uniref:Fumarate reductase n=1 Tax=Trichophyton tonsurans (strain CBS 112818) TaxID=647933 RepID=F2RS13_TRIT1|nr:fumarate reductase [Trichophyton tonsurans CBS 112818]
MAPRVIVVGGGLSGLSAAHTVYLNGGNVLLLDKQNFFGGNSTKATSGINGALTRTQVDLGIQDSVKQFYEDTLKSARDKARPELIKVLTYKSAAAVEWLQDVFNLDLTLVSRLGGHSFPRTHRGHDAKFPGMAITYALMQRLEELTEKDPERMKVLKKARVVAVNKEGNQVTGVTYEYNGQTHTEEGVVVLATGGYAADFTETSLLKKWRPDTIGLSSTNGVHATGDGQKMLMAIGANGIDMDKVQVHPTGLIDPKDPGSKWKFLAAEALRGEGGILLNSDGERFADELGHRDYVSGQMWKEKEKKKWPIRLVLNSKASNILDFHTRHYSGRGLMKKMTGAELAKEIGCGEAALRKIFDEWCHGANRLGGSSLLGCVVYGRVAGDSASQYLFQKLLKNPAASSAAGGAQQRLNQISLHIDPNQPGKVSVEWSDPSGKPCTTQSLAAPSTATASASTSASPTSSSSSAPAASSGAGAGATSAGPEPVAADVANFKVPEKEFTMEEVAKHNKKDDLWIVVKGVVMDVTNWLDEHPGGAQALFSHMGRDATEEFEMLHDDEVIPKYAAGVVIGRVKGQTPSLEY